MQTEDQDERADLVASITQSVEAGTYRVAAEDVAAAIMSGPFFAYLRRLSLVDRRRSADPSQRDDDQ